MTDQNDYKIRISIVDADVSNEDVLNIHKPEKPAIRVEITDDVDALNVVHMQGGFEDAEAAVVYARQWVKDHA